MRGSGSCLGKGLSRGKPTAAKTIWTSCAGGVPCSLPSPGISAHWQELKGHKIWKFSVVLCSTRHPSSVAVFRFAGLRFFPGLPAAFSIPAGCTAPVCSSAPGLNTQVREVKFTFPFRNQGRRDVCHFCVHKHQLTPHFHRFFPAFHSGPAPFKWWV